MGLITSFPGGNGGSEITVDSELSGTSENPVQNKVIKGVLDKTFKTDDELVVGAAQDNDYFPHYSTGFSKQCRISFSHIKATLKNYFDTLYSTIKTSEAAAQGGTDLSLVTTGEKYAWNNPSSVPIVANQFDKANIYSTTEKIVGCWTDGRPLYQKTVSFGALPDTTTKEVNHNISNINEVVRVFGISNDGDNNFHIIPLVGDGDGVVYQVSIKITKTKIVCKCDENMASFYPNTYITIQYTKTTDAANSFKYADENDYSTNEHIVGTWIDGKPIYQKTVNCGVLPDKSTKRIDHNISNLKAVLKLSGFTYNDTGGFILIPTYSAQGSGNDPIRLALNNTVIVITTNVNYTISYSNDVYVTIQYTKTTD